MSDDFAARLAAYADAIDPAAPEIAHDIRVLLAERRGHVRGAALAAERGRRLASERDDLIAAGADPAELEVPL